MMVNTRLLLLFLANEFSFCTSPPPSGLPGTFLMCFQMPHLVLTLLPGSRVCGGEREQDTEAALGLGLASSCRLPPRCRHHFASPSAALKATIDQSPERFAAAALDGPSEKLIVVNSQQIKPHQLVSWAHQ